MYNRDMEQKLTYKKLCQFTSDEKKMLHELAKGETSSINRMVRIAVQELYAKKTRKPKIVT